MIDNLTLGLERNWIDFIFIILVPLVLAFVCYKAGLLTGDGAASSFAVGVIIGSFASFKWMLVLIIFTAIGFAVTYYRLSIKKQKHLQEGIHGERSWKNVWGVSAPCCGWAILSFFADPQFEPYIMFAYISSVAVAAADTVASEIGTRDKNAVLITTFKRVEPGTNGGISVTGTVAAFLAAAAISIIGWAVVMNEIDFVYFLIPTVAGFAGCMLDSLVGATLETKGYLNKYDNNGFTGVAGGLIGMGIFWLLI